MEIIKVQKTLNPCWDIIVTGDFNSNLLYSPAEDEIMSSENELWTIPPTMQAWIETNQ